MTCRIILLLFCIIISEPVISGDYSVTLYAIPATTQIDFSTPRRMAWTAFGNAMTMHFSQRKNAMGHVFIELTGPDKQIFTGSTKRRLFASGRQEILDGYGLGILFRGIEGKVEFGNIVIKDLPTHYHNGDIAFLKAHISEDNYTRLIYYLEEYQRRGYDTIYNGLNKPREGLGAGCTAFGLSFFEVAGILHPSWQEAWTVDVRVPYRLIGGPITGQFVSLEEVFTARWWADEDEPHKIFSIVDPYLIYDWIHDVWHKLMTETKGDFSELREEDSQAMPVLRVKAKGLVFDFSSSAVPDEPVFLPPSDTLR